MTAALYHSKTQNGLCWKFDILETSTKRQGTIISPLKIIWTSCEQQLWEELYMFLSLQQWEGKSS